MTAVLHGVRQSGPVYGPHVLLRYLGVKFEYKVVDLRGGEQRQPAFLALNPFHHVPVFVDADGFSVFESNSILRYVAQKYGQGKSDLYPESIESRTQVEMWLDWRHTELNPHAGKVAYPILWGNPATEVEAGLKGLAAAFNTLSAQLKKTKAFVAGSALTIADISLLGIFLNLDAANYEYPVEVLEYRQRVRTALADVLAEIDDHPDSLKNYVASKRKPVLFTFPGSPFPVAPAALLEHLEVPYTARVVDLMTGEQRQPYYLTINPNGHVPAFRDNTGFVVWESNAIIRYIAQKYGSKVSTLYPSDPKLRSQIDRLLDVKITELGTNGFKFPRYYIFGQGTPESIVQAREDVKKAYDVIEGILGTQNFLTGADVTVADVALTPIFWMLKAYGVEPSAKLSAWLDRIFAAVKGLKTHADIMHGIHVPFYAKKK